MTFREQLKTLINKYAEHYYNQMEGWGSTHTLSEEECVQQIIDLIDKEIIGEDDSLDKTPGFNPLHPKDIQQRIGGGNYVKGYQRKRLRR